MVDSPKPPPEQRDGGVLWTVYLLGLAQARINLILYAPVSWVGRKLGFGRGKQWQSNVIPPDFKPPGLYFNYFYALGLARCRCIGPLACGRVRPWVLGFVFVGCSRVVSSCGNPCRRARMVLDRTHSLILAAERNLIFLFIDSLFVITATALLLRESDHSATAIRAWIQSMATFTLNGRQGDVENGWSDGAAILGTVSGLLLGVATLAVVMGLIQDRFKEDPGPYIGPLRISKPRRRID